MPSPYFAPAVIAASLCLSLAMPPARAQGQADDPAAFARCLDTLSKEAGSRGVSAATFERYARPLAPDMSVLALLDYQPEFRTPIWDYMAGLVDDERIQEGKRLMAEWQDTLSQVESRYGVDPATVVAVWGVESNFGQTFGKRPLLTSLSTLSCFGRRQRFFQGEFFTTLQIIEQGHIAPEQLVGSWAGAFGHTQFMPSTFMRIAVDFDGDGRRDLVGSVPDALASTANFLSRSGWRAEQSWGYEVRLPAGFDTGNAGRRNKRPLAEWQARGLRLVNGAALPQGNQQAGLLLPAGAEGPAFLVTRNFDALYAYNAAESYALAIAHLSDRLRGGEPFATPWPTDDPGLSRAARREVQSLLLLRGYDIGEIDGVIGASTRQAIMAVQAELGLPVDGRAGRKLLEALNR